MAIQIYVIKNVNNGHCYGSFNADKDPEEQVLGPFEVPTDRDEPYGYPCHADAAMEVLTQLDLLGNNCQFRDLLMVFFTAGFLAGMNHKQHSVRAELGMS